MPRAVDRHEVQGLIEQAAQLIDVLGASEYRHSHLPGAVPLEKLAERADDQLDGTRPAVAIMVDGNVGREWHGEGHGAQVRDGADSYVVRDGRIVAQTIHYRVEPA